MRAYVCTCVRACIRACVHACVHEGGSNSLVACGLSNSLTFSLPHNHFRAGPSIEIVVRPKEGTDTRAD